MPVIATQQHVATITSKGVTSSALSATSVQTTIQAEGVGITRTYYIDGKDVSIGTSGMQISALFCVAVNSDNLVMVTTRNDLNQQVAGIAITSTTGAGQNIDVQVAGVLQDSSFHWDVTMPIFLGIDGRLTQVPTSAGKLQIVGYPEGTSAMTIAIETATKRAT